jgi:2-keto-3-deoxy-6-phosphogluconate aldolase
MATGDGTVLLEQQVESLRTAPGSAAGITPNQAQQQTAAATSMPGTSWHTEAAAAVELGR